MSSSKLSITDTERYNNTIDTIALGLIPGIGPRILRTLIRHCGSARQVFTSTSKSLCKIHGIGPNIASSVKLSTVLGKAEEEVKYCLDNDIDILLFEDEGFPRRLRHCIDSPYVLFRKGRTDLNNPRMVSIVGTRKATDYGRDMTRKMVRSLSPAGVTIVSGLAIGIDGHAHTASLDYGAETIAVVAHGHKTVYPKRHHHLAERILESGGALVTEFVSNVIPERFNFPARNRIVAGMVEAVIVVESAIKGGGLITADIANSYNRDVFAIPGKTTDEFSRGCHYLIRKHLASIVESGEDVLKYLDWETSDDVPGSTFEKVHIPDLTSSQRAIYNFILQENQSVQIDDIRQSIKISGDLLLSELLSLELLGVIVSRPGKSYSKA